MQHFVRHGVGGGEVQPARWVALTEIRRRLPAQILQPEQRDTDPHHRNYRAVYLGGQEGHRTLCAVGVSCIDISAGCVISWGVSCEVGASWVVGAGRIVSASHENHLASLVQPPSANATWALEAYETSKTLSAASEKAHTSAVPEEPSAPRWMPRLGPRWNNSARWRSNSSTAPPTSQPRGTPSRSTDGRRR